MMETPRMRRSRSSLKPVSKVTAAAFAGAVTTIVVAMLERYAGWQVGGDVAAAFTLVFMTIAGYLIPLE